MDFSPQAPYNFATLLSGSDNKVKPRSYLPSNFFCIDGSSGLILRRPLCCMPAWYSPACRLSDRNIIISSCPYNRKGKLFCPPDRSMKKQVLCRLYLTFPFKFLPNITHKVSIRITGFLFIR